MATMEHITLKGKNGNQYVFSVHSIDYECREEGGIYIYTKRTPMLGLGGNHVLIYIGRTDSFVRRNYEHDNHPCITSHEPNRICLMREGNEQKRIAIEKDILLANNTSCNIQHNS